MKALLIAILLLVLALTSCQHEASYSRSLAQLLLDNKGNKVTVYLRGGSQESRFVGKVVEVDPSSNLLTLESEYRFTNNSTDKESTRTSRHYVALDQVSAVRIDEK